MPKIPEKKGELYNPGSKLQNIINKLNAGKKSNNSNVINVNGSYKKKVDEKPLKELPLQYEAAPIERPLKELPLQYEAAPQEQASPGINISEHQAEVLAGATPALVGMLFGRRNEGAPISARYYKDMFDERAAKRKLASKGGSGTLYNYIDPKTGKAVKGYANEAHGNEPATALTDRAFKQREDIKENKEIAKGTRKGEYGVSYKGFNITPADRKGSEKARDKFITVNNKSMDALDKIRGAAAAIDINGMLPKRFALGTLMKSVEGTRMSDEDRRYYSGNVSIVRNILEQVGVEKSGAERKRLISEAKAYMKIAADTIVKSLEKRARKLADHQGLGDKGRADYYYNEISGFLNSDVLPKFKSDIKQLKQKKVTELTDEELDAELKSYEGAK